MLLNDKGIAIRNPNAKHLYTVQMHYGRTRWWTSAIPADTPHEAEVIANNEDKHAISTGKIELIK